MSQNEQKLLQRIAQLEAEVKNREEDLATYRRELSQANERLQNLMASLSRDLKVAAKIQRVLLPTEFPNIGGFEFSSKFVASAIQGGDYLDIFEHEDKMKFGVLISAATGFGMSSLLLSAILKFSGQIEARRGAKPEKVLAMLADEVLEDAGEADLADLFYMIVDRRSYTMTYCSAGENLALVQSYGTGELTLLKPQQGGLSTEGQRKFESSSVSLNPKDRLILCSRGAIEVKNLENESFGQERLFNALVSAPKTGVHDVRNHLLFEIKKFLSGREPTRDVTVLVAEVKDRVIKLATT